ncbi:MAG: polymorphic toxin type 44 domain-containing protein [Bacteroidota bacterium]
MKVMAYPEDRGKGTAQIDFQSSRHDWSGLDEMEARSAAARFAVTFWGNIMASFYGGTATAPAGVILMNNGAVISNDGKCNSVYVHHFSDDSYHYKGELGGKIDANEIIDNILKANVKTAGNIINPGTFADLVRKNGDWDYKNNTKTIFGLAVKYDDQNKTSTKFTFYGQEMDAYEFGNFHYGVVGKALYFGSEQLLLRQAGAAQITDGTSEPQWQKYKEIKASYQIAGYGSQTQITFREMIEPYGDDPHDQEMIKKGFKYYDTHY